MRVLWDRVRLLTEDSNIIKKVLNKIALKHSINLFNEVYSSQDVDDSRLYDKFSYRYS